MSTPRIAFKSPAANLLRRCLFCTSTDTVEQPLLSCPCKQARYCNKKCQKDDWPSHKALCKRIREIHSQQDLNRMNGHGLSDGVSREISKRWVLIKKDLLGVSVVDALHLQSFLDRMDTHLLIIALVPSPTFPKGEVPCSNEQVARSFELLAAQAVTLETAISLEPQYKEILPTTFEVNRDKNKKYQAQGGPTLGTATIVVTVPDMNLARIIPWIVQRAQLTVRNENWEEHLRASVSLGMDRASDLRIS